MVSFCVVCLPVLVRVPVQRPETTADATALVLPALKPVTVIRSFHRVTTIKRIDAFLAVRVPAPSAVVFVIILVAVVPRITGQF